jgi:hypothetical protein
MVFDANQHYRNLFQTQNSVVSFANKTKQNSDTFGLTSDPEQADNSDAAWDYSSSLASVGRNAIKCNIRSNS